MIDFEVQIFFRIYFLNFASWVDAFVSRKEALTTSLIPTFRFIICLLGHLNFRMHAMKTRGIGWGTI